MLNLKETFRKRFESARVMSGLTYQEVAKHLEVSKQVIQQYETGRAFPDSTKRIKISELFNVSLDYFFREVKHSFDNLQFRAYESKLSQYKLRAIEERVKQKLENYLELLELLELENEFEPLEKFKIECYEDLDKATMWLRNKWNLGSSPIPKLTDVLESNNIIVVHINKIFDFDGLSGTVNEKYPFIAINEMTEATNICRDRLSLGHELAHLVLEFDEAIEEKTAHKWCNEFASRFILPASELEKELINVGSGIPLTLLKMLQKKWGISVEALVVRLRHIGFVTSASSEQFWKFRNKSSNASIVKTFGEYDIQETSYKLNTLVLTAFEFDKIPDWRAAEMLDMTIEKFNECF